MGDGEGVSFASAWAIADAAFHEHGPRKPPGHALAGGAAAESNKLPSRPRLPLLGLPLPKTKCPPKWLEGEATSGNWGHQHTLSGLSAVSDR